MRSRKGEKMNPTQAEVLQPFIDEAKRLWHKLEPKYQAGIVFITAASVTALGKTLAATFLDADHPCLQWGCIRHAVGSSIGAAVTAGLVAGRAFFMRPGPGPKPPAPLPFPADSPSATS
jgi:hypothetical protein